MQCFHCRHEAPVAVSVFQQKHRDDLTDRKLRCPQQDSVGQVWAVVVPSSVQPIRHSNRVVYVWLEKLMFFGGSRRMG